MVIILQTYVLPTETFENRMKISEEKFRLQTNNRQVEKSKYLKGEKC